MLGKHVTTQTSQPVEERYSLGKVFELLDQIGKARLQVNNPKIKVLLTLIARKSESHLRGDANENPSDNTVMVFQDHLESVQRVVEQYILIQDEPQKYPDSETLMEKGFQAIDAFASTVMKTDVPGGRQSLTNFRVDTDILSAQQFK